MKFCKLRIAWSVAWSVVAVLVCVLWVRSYCFWDTAYFRLGAPNMLVANSFKGSVDVFAGIIERLDQTGWFPRRLGFETLTTKHVAPSDLVRRGWHYSADVTGHYITFPHWCLILVALTGVAAPWLPWRFSLSTLLIATTFVAVVLGRVVWCRAWVAR